MKQITIELSSDLESQIKTLANSLGLTMNKYISTILEQKVQSQWSSHTHHLAGVWEDFPTLEEIRSHYGKDVQREEF